MKANCRLRHQQTPARFSRHSAGAVIGGLACLLIASAGIFSHAQRARAPQGGLNNQIAQLIAHPDVREAHWGVSVVSMKKGTVITEVNAAKLFIPASTAKVFPAAVAWSLLGKDYKYTTYVELQDSSKSSESEATMAISQPENVSISNGEVAGDLVIVGRGDPNLSGRIFPFEKETERDLGPIAAFGELAAGVAGRGIRVVKGDLIADDTFFVHQPYGTGWEHDDLSWLSATPVSALAINDNVLFLSVFPAAPMVPAIVQEVPMPGYYEIENRTLTIPARVAGANGRMRRARKSLGLGREPGSLRLQLWGEIPEGAPESSYAVSIENPPRFAAEYFRRELESRGVKVSGEVKVRRMEPRDVDDLDGAPVVRQGETPAVPPPLRLAEHVSLPLSESLRAMMKVSQNLHAEMLLRTLGKERRGVGSVEAGLAAIQDFLIANKMSARGVNLRDGSGLSRQNLVSPSAMTALLKLMYQSEQGAAWTVMLPEAGVDGTLRNRLRGRYTTGRVWAKTGSLMGVATLAGYVRNQSDDLLAFAIFANHYNDDEGSVISVIDQIVTALARSR